MFNPTIPKSTLLDSINKIYGKEAMDKKKEAIVREASKQLVDRTKSIKHFINMTNGKHFAEVSKTFADKMRLRNDHIFKSHLSRKNLTTM